MRRTSESLIRSGCCEWDGIFYLRGILEAILGTIVEGERGCHRSVCCMTEGGCWGRQRLKWAGYGSLARQSENGICESNN